MEWVLPTEITPKFLNIFKRNFMILQIKKSCKKYILFITTSVILFKNSGK